VHHYNSTQYCNTETAFINIPFCQTNITSQMWPSGGGNGYTACGVETPCNTISYNHIYSGIAYVHSLANRHSCSTSPETRDRKCFSMQLIWLLSTLLSTVVTAMCACIRNTNLCFFQCMHASRSWSTLYPTSKFWVMKTASLSHNSNRHAVQYKRPVATWPPMWVVSLVYYLHCGLQHPQCRHNQIRHAWLIYVIRWQMKLHFGIKKPKYYTYTELFSDICSVKQISFLCLISSRFMFFTMLV